MRLVGPINSGAAAGGAGVATAHAQSDIRLLGEILGIYIKYNDAPPAGTTDVTVKTVGTSPAAPSYNIVVVSNAATDGWFRPVQQGCDAAGAPVAGAYVPTLVYDFIDVAIAQANNADNVDVWVLLK